MAGASTDKETPLMKQYHSIKAQYPGAILLFRVGDFYETFSEDARIASKVLGIVLTKRSNGAASDQDLAGFPIIRSTTTCLAWSRPVIAWPYVTNWKILKKPKPS